MTVNQIIENFKFDMADELNITFAEAGHVIRTLISIKDFADMIQISQTEATTIFTKAYETRKLQKSQQNKREAKSFNTFTNSLLFGK